MNPTEHKSDTPETDAAVGASWPAKAVMTCRKLERELSRAQANNERNARMLAKTLIERDQARRERDEARRTSASVYDAFRIIAARLPDEPKEFTACVLSQLEERDQLRARVGELLGVLKQVVDAEWSGEGVHDAYQNARQAIDDAMKGQE